MPLCEDGHVLPVLDDLVVGLDCAEVLGHSHRVLLGYGHVLLVPGEVPVGEGVRNRVQSGQDVLHSKALDVEPLRDGI